MNKIHNTNEAYVILKKYPIVYSLDMHDNSTYGYLVDTSTGEIIDDCNIMGKVSSVVKYIEEHHREHKEKMIILFEAGPLGTSPYRAFSKTGYECRMIAPSSIPHKGKRQKTDRRDAIDNLHYFTSGTLRFVTIQDENDEEAREWLRYRQELQYQVTKQKQRILNFLKRHGFEYTETKTNWTKAHYTWLRTKIMPNLLREFMDVLIDDLESHEKKLSTVDATLDRLFQSNSKFNMLSNLYANISGFGRIGSMTMVLEAGDLSRFHHPTAIMNYFGVIPQKHASGVSDPSLHITKAGNTYVRRALITAANAYKDRRMLRKSDEIKKLPEPLQKFIKCVQDRLNRRYRDLRAKKKHSNKVKCAIARELCGFLWELVVEVAPKLEQSQSVKIAA